MLSASLGCGLPIDRAGRGHGQRRRRDSSSADRSIAIRAHRERRRESVAPEAATRQSRCGGPSNASHEVSIVKTTSITPKVTQITAGLRFPEGPVAMVDGLVILVEIEP